MIVVNYVEDSTGCLELKVRFTAETRVWTDKAVIELDSPPLIIQDPLPVILSDPVTEERRKSEGCWR